MKTILLTTLVLSVCVGCASLTPQVEAVEEPAYVPITDEAWDKLYADHSEMFKQIGLRRYALKYEAQLRVFNNASSECAISVQVRGRAGYNHANCNKYRQMVRDDELSMVVGRMSSAHKSIYIDQVIVPPYRIAVEVRRLLRGAYDTRVNSDIILETLR